MDPELQGAKGVFERAIELDAAVRADYVRVTCADDAALRDRVERLLVEHDKQGDFLASRSSEPQVDRRRSLPNIVGHYRLLEKLGSGGMGEVWKAEDIQLRRTVALKFLFSEAVGDDEVKLRLIREAQASASLDHANIRHIYGIHEHEGEIFIAMAYVDGPSLAETIRERPRPVDDAVGIAIQIAAGLQEAHEKGIVHRDIKPQNIILTQKGQVKIMDFGLASLTGRSKLSKTGTTLGTPAYMAPEQLKGLEVDRRADIWAFGCVFYEMLTQRTPFEADYEQAITHGILNEQPEPVTALRSGLPVEIDRIVGKALAKDPGGRYQHADDLIVDLRALSNSLATATSRSTQLAHSSGWAGEPSSLADEQIAARRGSSEAGASKWKLRIHQVVLVGTAAAALTFSFLYLRQGSPETPLRQFAISPPAPLGFGAAISPNGRHIAFTTGGSDGRLWIQDLDKQQPRAIEGAQADGETLNAPFWSPGSDFVGYESGGQLMKIPVQGGLAIRLCKLPGALLGATWSPDGGSIVFSANDPYALHEVPAAGGAVKRILLPEELSAGGPWGVMVRPHFLPAEAGARVVVFSFGSPRNNSLMVQDLETGRRHVLGPGCFPFYSSSGHLLYQPAFHTDELWALPFALETLTATGKAFPIANSGMLPTVAADQTLAFVDRRTQWRLVWLDRQGRETELSAQPEGVRNSRLSLSSDGRLIAYSATHDSNMDVWIWDIAKGVKSRLTTAPADDSFPRWSPTGEEIAFTSNRAGNLDIFSVRTDGNSGPEALVATLQGERAQDWSRDGKYLLYERITTETGVDLWYLERDGGTGDWEPHLLVQTPFAETNARFSPDVRYVAYVSDETGQDEVYVRSFPDASRKWTVSPDGGQLPLWSRDGKELFYRKGSELIAVSVSTSPSFSIQSAAPLPGVSLGGYYDISPDSRRILLNEPVGETPERLIRVVQNWYEEFRDRDY